jgi:F-type H+-transporting ATPase subunit epsilon
MFLEIVSPEAVLFSGEVEAVTVPGVHGEFQMLDNHAPIVSLLQKGNVKIKGDVVVNDVFKDRFSTNGSDTILVIDSGTIELNDNKIIILAD